MTSMPDRLAILIGNGRFENDADLPTLLGPRHDVSSLGEILSDPDIGNFIVFEHLDRDSRLLVSELERQVSIDSPDATVLLYYGGFVVSTPGKGLYLATADTELADVGDTAVPVSFVKGLLRRCPARHKVVVLDCCYGSAAGGADESDVERQLRRIRSDVDTDLHLIASPASARSVQAREATTDAGVEGRLTRCIVGGLVTGAADRDADNQTSVRGLNEYLGLRLGDDRPLWAGPLEGVDPRIVAHPDAIDVASIGSFDTDVPASEPRSRRLVFVGVVLALLIVVLAAGIMMRGETGEPEIIRLEEFYDGSGLPESVGLVKDLQVLRAVVDRTGWIEHTEPLDGLGPRHPSAVTLVLDSAHRGASGTIDLGLRQWALVEMGEGVQAIGIACADGLNIAEATVEMVDGRRYVFDVRTDRPGSEFIGFVARDPIHRVRLTSTSVRFVAERLYFYAQAEHRAVEPGRP